MIHYWNFSVVTLRNPKIHANYDCNLFPASDLQQDRINFSKQRKGYKETNKCITHSVHSIPGFLFFYSNFASGDLQIKKTFSVSMIISDFLRRAPNVPSRQFSDTKWCPVTTKVSLAAVSYNNPSSIRTICRREQRHVLGWQNCGKTLMFHWKFAFLCCIFVVVFFSFKIGGDVLGTTSGLTN